ncbi:MAG: PD-(D/E)XK nuclease family protein, partial [Anaerovoracaceae bacterium]
VFAQYGMDLFLDQKRDILHSPAVAYLVALMDCITKGYRREDVIRLIKTGLTQLSLDEGELLENYANQYRLMGSRWKKPLEKGLMTHGEDKIAELEALRCRLMEPILQFAEEFKQEKTVEEKVRRLYHFLREDAGVPQKLEALIEEQLEGGKAEAAEETAQIWNIIVGILEQLIAIVGEENLSLSAFNLVLTAGFEAVEIGVLPPTLDGIIMGTMQRTRSSRVKALLVLGANEGVLPALGGGDSILSEEEKLWLNARGIELCKIDELRVMEENLAIYKNLARPTEEVWMSCSASDEEGKAINPSSIFTKIAEIYPGLEIEKDILNQGEAMGLIGGMESTLEHVATALRKAEGEDSLEDPLKEAALWFKAYRPEAFNKIWRGLHFDNKAEQLTTEIAQSLYLKEANNPLTLSPSRLELFGKCPFSHFVSYGLRPEQPRDYTVEALDMGDLYHRCLMLLSRRLSVGGKEITAEDSLWMTISREDCDAAVEEILEGEMETYREGLLKAGAAEAYRGDRIKEICKETAWNMITQVRAGKIISMEYEVPFGKGRNLSPIIIQHEGKEIHIEGKIDRMDTLVGERIKVVDYKSGKDKYSEAEALGGWKLQLFVYLRAGCRAEKKPAGAFYFHIDEPRIDAGGCSEEEVAAYIEKEIPKIFKMDGVMVNDEEVVASIAGDFDRYSTIVPVKKTKGVYGGTSPGKVLEEEEFTQLVCAVYQKVDELCIQLSSGIIEIKPRRTESQSACTHCKFKGICKFDASFEGCEYVKIRSK